MRRLFACFVLIIFILTSQLSVLPVGAQSQNTSGIAVYIQLKDKGVQEGDIVVLSNDGYKLGNVPYDTNIVGVVVKEPAIAFEDRKAGSYPIVSEGKVFMRVSANNGAIKKGDMLTTSSIQGVGQKAVESGFIAATALQDYNSNTPGKILVVLSTGRGKVTTSGAESLLKSFAYLLNVPNMSPISLFRYIFAGIMLVLSFFAALGYFGKLSSLGVEALGRNPLASKTIVLGIFLNTLIALGIIIGGIVVGYIILVI